MATGFRVVVETYDTLNNETLTREEVDNLLLQSPKHINDVGLNQQQQIKILQNILDVLLPQQFVLLDEEDICPECGKKTKKAGSYTSQFHSVYSDHKVQMVRRQCQCGWQRKYTVEGYFGFSSHPDLLKMQCDVGSEQSYMKAQESLAKKNGRVRGVNNRSHIARTVSTFGEALSELKSHFKEVKPIVKAKTLVAQIDGGHISTNIKGKRSYEVLAGKFYQPEHLIETKSGTKKLTRNTCIASAKSDNLQTMKKQVLYAAKKEGLTSDTLVYLIADGGKNCWNAASVLKNHCKEVISILDWNHIGRAFKHAEQELPEEYRDKLDRAKWNLWHGDSKKSQNKLALIYDELKDKMKLPKLAKLRRYIKNNESHIIHYADYMERKLPFTSSIIEGAVDNIINDRQKRNRKMQWTREGAHPIVQLRASKASNTWDQDWENAIEYLLAA